MSETTNQITRREILKRGAFVGGAVIWATPVVQTLGMGRAFAQTPSDVCIASWADQWVAFRQGKTKSGATIHISRSQPDRAVGAPGPSDSNSFVSLGYRDPALDTGVLIMRLEIPYYSGKNGEAVVVETTFTAPDYPEEKARVLVSGSESGPWVHVGFAYNNVGSDPSLTKIPLDSVGGLPAIVRFVKLVDETDPTPHNAISDGFDVNAVGISCPASTPQ